MTMYLTERSKYLEIVMLGAGLDVMGGISSVEKLILDQGVSEVNLQHIATLQDVSLIQKILVFNKAIFDFARILLNGRVDLVHIHFSSRGSTFRTLILIVFVLAFRKPIILHSHGSGFHLFYKNQVLWIQKIISYLFSKTNRIIVLSNSWKEFYINSLDLEESKIAVLPNPVKLPSQNKYHKNSSTVKFIFLGRIGERKGAFELIEAFSRIPVELRNIAALTMAGDGDVEVARNLVDDLNLTDKVTILDWVNSQERDTLLNESDVFVLPSQNEGLPMAMIEAMSFGLSVITTPVGGIPELITHGNNGMLIEPGNIEELSSAMQSLIENENIRHSLGIKAKQSVASLDIEKYCLSLKSVYQEIV